MNKKAFFSSASAFALSLLIFSPSLWASQQQEEGLHPTPAAHQLAPAAAAPQKPTVEELRELLGASSKANKESAVVTMRSVQLTEAWKNAQARVESAEQELTQAQQNLARYQEPAKREAAVMREKQQASTKLIEKLRLLAQDPETLKMMEDIRRERPKQGQ